MTSVENISLRAMRRKLLKLTKVQLIKHCKKYKVSHIGTKNEMSLRIIQKLESKRKKKKLSKTKKRKKEKKQKKLSLVSFECADSSPTTSLFAQKSIELSIYKHLSNQDAQHNYIEEDNLFELKKEILFNCVLTVKGFVKAQHLKRAISNIIEDLILIFYAKPINMNIKYKHSIRSILYCPINDTWQSITDKMLLQFQINKAQHRITSLYWKCDGKNITRDIDRFKWATTRWGQDDIFEIKIAANNIVADSWAPTFSNTLSPTDIPTTEILSPCSSNSLNLASIPRQMSLDTTGNISSNPFTFSARRVRFDDSKTIIHEYDEKIDVLSMDLSGSEAVILEYPEEAEEQTEQYELFLSSNGMPYKYSASLSTGVYGSNLYYEDCRQQWLNNNRDGIGEYRQLDVVKRLEYSVPNKISTDYLSHKLFIEGTQTLQLHGAAEYNDIIVTNTTNEHYALDLDVAIFEIQKDPDEDWRAVLYDVCLYHLIECRLQNIPMFNVTNIKFGDAKRENEWREYLYEKGHSVETVETVETFRKDTQFRHNIGLVHRKKNTRTSQIKVFGERVLMNDLIELGGQHKIRDSILGYHHYTIAVSHIIKVYEIFYLYKLSVVFIINKRYSMYQHGFTRDIPAMLREAKMPYSWHRLNGFLLNETIKIIFRTLGEYKQKYATCNGIVLLFKFNVHKNKTHQTDSCTMYIYGQNGQSILPNIDNSHWSLFILEFQYLRKNCVKCYWKIDGKTLRFFPEHMETVWPRYFLMKQQNIKRLIFHHKYRHQFGIGLYDKSFCTLYYALTKKRFLSTHYYREYHCKPKLSLRALDFDLEFDEKQLYSQCETFKKLLNNDNNDCDIDEQRQVHKCNRIRRLVFMLKKHGNGQLSELCCVLQKCNSYDLNDIHDDIEHLMKKHYAKFEEIFNHIFNHMVNVEHVSQCTVKLACWPLRRRTRSIYRVELEAKNYDNDREPLAFKQIRRILDHLHCDVFHRDPHTHFQQMFVDRSKTGTLHTETLGDFERIILQNAPTLKQLYDELKNEGLSEMDKNKLNVHMLDRGYVVDRIRIIQDLEEKNSCNIYQYIQQLPHPRVYEKVISKFVDNYYLRIAAIFRKYKIREEIFCNAAVKDIKDLIQLENVNFGEADMFAEVYQTIRFHGKLQKQNSAKDDEKQSQQTADCEFIAYTADNSDKWLSEEHEPAFATMENELLSNSFQPIARSDFIDTELECQTLHEKEKNINIMALEELIALKVFTDYSNLQREFSMAYYSDNCVEKKRKREFYHWNLMLKQAMHYAARPSDKNQRLWRGLKGLFHFESFTAIAQQPTSFSLEKQKAEKFCGVSGDNGILLESSDAIGIPLKWLSNFEHEDEWWCFNTTFKLERVHIKTKDIAKRVNYLRYSLQKMPHELPNGDINFFAFDINRNEEDECKDNDEYIKLYVIDILDFEEKDAEILKVTKYNKLTLLQRLFFELKQYYVLEKIWDFERNDIETSSKLQRLYLLEKHIFANINANKYKQHIRDFMVNSELICIDSSFCRSIAGYIQFIQIAIESIKKYNQENKNKIKITEPQEKEIINYFKIHVWKCDTFIETDPKQVKLHIFVKQLGIQRTPSYKLYKMIVDRISNAAQLNIDEIEQFHAEIIKYKQMENCNSAQLIYIFKKHIFPKMHQKSATIIHEKSICKYMQENGNDNIALCDNIDTFSENIANYIRENGANEEEQNDGNAAFIQILNVSIDQHQSKYYAKSKKKLFHLNKEKIINYFKLSGMDCAEFGKTARKNFSKQILFNKLKIKMGSGNKLYDIMREIVVTTPSKQLSFCDLYRAINKWKTDQKMRKSDSILEHKLRNHSFDAFCALIGDFDLEFIYDTTEFQLKGNAHQHHLLAQFPPKFKLMFKKNNNEWEITESTTTSFRLNVCDIINKPSQLQYKISLKYDKHELISQMQTIQISSEVIAACKSIHNILSSKTK